MSEVENCFEKGLLKKCEKSKTMALQDIEMAEFFLNEGYDLIDLGKKEMAIIAMYNSVFHAARALLYLEGVGEKSHYCLQKYIEEKFSGKGLLSDKDLSLFDLLRGMRQETQYNLRRIPLEEDFSELYNKAEAFVEKAKKIVLGSAVTAKKSL